MAVLRAALEHALDDGAGAVVDGGHDLGGHLGNAGGDGLLDLGEVRRREVDHVPLVDDGGVEHLGERARLLELLLARAREGIRHERLGERRLACSLPCRRCGQCYPPAMYPETMRPDTAPGLAHAWALLQDAERASVGEVHVQQALEAAEEAIRCLAHRPPQAAGQPSEANAGVRFRRPGTWWLLNTAIRVGNAQALSRLCCLPQFIEALTPKLEALTATVASAAAAVTTAQSIVTKIEQGDIVAETTDTAEEAQQA